jgi:hypothetical protein
MQAPPQPPNVEKVEGAPGVSVRVTCEPLGKLAEQVFGQLMPAGELTTVPVTLPLAETLTWTVLFPEEPTTPPQPSARLRNRREAESGSRRVADA